MIVVKVRKEQYTQKAVRIFTDRQEPRDAFWKKYNLLKAEMSEMDDIHVLTYYGIGGIGKSRLLDKLKEEMEEKITNPYYAEIDFNNYQDSRITLNKLKSTLSEKYRFVFPLFELGNYAYAKHVGERIDSPEIKSIAERSPFLSLLKSVLGTIPVVNIAANVFDIADQGLTYIINHLKNNKRELVQIEAKSTEELRVYLPFLFAKDLAHNLEKISEPMVIFIDTYEQLVNELCQIGEPLQNDLWIRDENGLIQNVPNVLWVIAGREKIKWDRFDSEWEEALEQHPLGNLSFPDSDGFLLNEGINDAILRKELYNLTNGTPMYLDICVDRFIRIKEKGETPDISMFGKDTHSLIERFVRYMGDSQKDFIYMLSCIKIWNDELIFSVAPSILPNFSPSAYEKVKDYSFVILSDDDYSIHQTVGDVLLKNCPELIKKRTAEQLIKWSTEITKEKNLLSPEYSSALLYMLHSGFLLYSDNEELYIFYKDNIQEKLQALIDAGVTELADNMIDMILSRCNPEKNERLYASMLVDKAYVLNFCGEFSMAKDYAEKAVELYSELLGEEHPDTLNAMHNLASCYSHLGNYNTAFELGRQVFEKRRELLGENDPDTLTDMSNLAGYYSGIGDYKTAFEVGKQVLEKRREVLGENHLDTLTAMNNLASHYSNLGDYKTAFEVGKQVLEKRREVLGENHPDTLVSMNNLASYYSDLGDYKTAFEVGKQVLEKRREVLGENHPDALVSMNNLASYYSKMGEKEKAFELSHQAYEKSCEILGEDHPNTLKAMSNLASYYSEIGEREKALELAQQTYEKRRDVLGENHPDTLVSMCNLAGYYVDVGEKEKAFELSHQAYEKSCEIPGEDHPDTLIIMSNLAGYYLDAREYNICLKLLEKLYEKRREVLGENHPSTLTTMNYLIKLLNLTGKRQKALLLTNKLKNIQKKSAGNKK